MMKTDLMIVGADKVAIEALSSAIVAKDAVRHMTVQFGTEQRGNLRFGTFMAPGAMRPSAVALLAERAPQAAPATKGLCVEAANLVVGSFRADMLGDPTVFLKALIQVLTSYPAFVSGALLDMRDPRNLIRQSKFPPVIAEVCIWADGLVAERKASAALAAKRLNDFASYEAARKDPDFFIEWEGDNRPSREAIAEAQERHAKIFAEEVLQCRVALIGGKRSDQFTFEVRRAAKLLIPIADVA
jgi:hypothetical protein